MKMSARRKGEFSDPLNVSRSSVYVTMGLLVLSTLYFLIPIWWLIVAASKDQSDLFSTPGLWFAEMNLIENIEKILSYGDGIYVRWLLNSLLYSGVGAAVGTLMAAALGYALAKYEFRGRGLIFGIVLSGILIPAPLLTIPLFLMWSRIGMVNTYWAVLIPSVVTPFGVYLSRIYAAAAVPDELIDAARIDGAGELRIFWTIALRIMSPALVTVGLFQAVAVWNNFFLPLVMLSERELYPVTLGLHALYSQWTDTVYDLVLAGSLLSIIPLIVAFLALQRFWRAGLTGGALKA